SGGSSSAPSGNNGSSQATTPTSGGQGSGPETPDDQVKWISTQNGNWDDPANWLDVTTNTNKAPDGNDSVTIDAPGVTVTVEAGHQAALSVHVATGGTLAISGGTLTLGSASEIDGGLIVSTTAFPTLLLGG